MTKNQFAAYLESAIEDKNTTASIKRRTKRGDAHRRCPTCGGKFEVGRRYVVITDGYQGHTYVTLHETCFLEARAHVPTPEPPYRAPRPTLVGLSAHTILMRGLNSRPAYYAPPGMDPPKPRYKKVTPGDSAQVPPSASWRCWGRGARPS